MLPIRLAVIAGIISYAVYLLTLSPGVSWEHHSEDSGDLITAAWVLGIPHPTGYPLFCILGWLWSHLLPFGSVAWRMNALSALWGALAAGVTVRACWTSFDLLPEETLNRITRFGRGIAALSTGLLLAFALDVWKQCVVTEVYSLNLFFVSIIGWILIEILAGAKKSEQEVNPDKKHEWVKRRSKLVSLLALSWGFAATNHLTSIFLFPGIALVLLFGKTGVRPGEILKGIFWFILPLLIYLYLPIRSGMDPPLDWGNPETLDSFLWVVTGQQFKTLMFSLLPYMMLHQVMRYMSLQGEFGFLGTLASGLGVCGMLLSRWYRVLILLGYSLLLMTSAYFFLSSYYIWDPEGYLLPSIWAASIWAGWSIVLLVSVPKKWIVSGRFAGILLLIVMPVWSLVANWAEADLSMNHDAINYGTEAFECFEPDAIVFEVRYERAFTLWYYREVEYAKNRDDVAVIYVEHATFNWGLDLLRRKYPDLVLPDNPFERGETVDADTIAWITRHNIASRPIYSGAIVNQLQDEGYRFEAVGTLFRVLPPE